MSVLPQVVPGGLYVESVAPEPREDVGREAGLKHDTVVDTVEISQVEVLVGIAEVVIAVVGIGGRLRVVGHLVGVLFPAVGRVAIVQAVVEGQLRVAFGVFGIYVGVVESVADGLFRVEAQGITVVQPAGVDVDERARARVASRRNGVILHVLDLVRLDTLQVVVGGFHAVDEDFQRLVEETGQLAGHGVDAKARQRGYQILALAGVPDLFVGESVGGMVHIVHLVMAPHRHSLEVVGVGAHGDGAHPKAFDAADDGLVAHV